MNRALRTLLYGNSLWAFATGMFAPLLAVFTQKIGGSLLDISSAYAIFLFVTGIMTILIGNMLDKPGRHEKVLVAGFMLTALLTFSYVFIENTLHLFLVEAGFGVATAMVNPAWYSLFSKNHNRKESGKEWGIYQGLQEMLMAIGTIAGGIIVTLFGFNVLFLLMGTLQVGVTIVYAQLLGNDRTKKTKMKH